MKKKKKKTPFFSSPTENLSSAFEGKWAKCQIGLGAERYRLREFA